MFRLISLIRAKDEANVPYMIDECERMIACEPLIRHGHVAAGLQLREVRSPHAHYSLLLDFADREMWERYAVGEPHNTLAENVGPFIETSISTQYVVPAEGEKP